MKVLLGCLTSIQPHNNKPVKSSTKTCKRARITWMGFLSVTHTNKLWSWKNDDKWSSFFSTTAVWLTTIWLNSVIYNKAIRSELTKSIHCSKYRNHSWPQEMWNNIHNFRAHQYRTKCLLYERGVLWVCHIQDSCLLISRTSCPTWTLN